VENGPGDCVLRLLMPDGDIKVVVLAYVVVVRHIHIEFRTHFGHIYVETRDIDNNLKGGGIQPLDRDGQTGARAQSESLGQLLIHPLERHQHANRDKQIEDAGQRAQVDGPR